MRIVCDRFDGAGIGFDVVAILESGYWKRRWAAGVDLELFGRFYVFLKEILL